MDEKECNEIYKKLQDEMEKLDDKQYELLKKMNKIFPEVAKNTIGKCYKFITDDNGEKKTVYFKIIGIERMADYIGEQFSISRKNPKEYVFSIGGYSYPCEEEEISEDEFEKAKKQTIKKIEKNRYNLKK